MRTILFAPRIRYIQYAHQVRVKLFSFDKRKTGPVHLSVIRYEAGDHVAVFPSNDETLVNRIGELLRVNLDEVISLFDVDGKLQNF